MLDKQEYNEPVMTGLIEGTDERDLLGSEIVINWELIPKKLPNPKSKLNQGANRKTRNSCTMAGALIQIGQLYDFEVDNNLLNELCDYAIKEENRDINKGRYVSAGCNTVRNFVKKKFGYEVVFVSYREYSENYKERNKRNGLTGIGYKSCIDYTLDFYDDSIVQGNGKDRKTKEGGHRTNNLRDGVFDSYYGRKNLKGGDSNFYKVPHSKDIREKGIYFPGMYIFFKKERIGNNFQKILKEKKEKIQINAFVNQGSLIHKYVKNPNLREDLELLADKFRKEYNLKREYAEEEKEKQVLLALLQKIKDKEINNQQIIEAMKKIVK